MEIDEQHVALPKLYGAPAYARPPTVAEIAARPFDPDVFPLEIEQTDEERTSVAFLRARAYETAGSDGGDRQAGEPDAGWLRPRLFSLRSIAGRLLGGS